jgi:hypothetical protein
VLANGIAAAYSLVQVLRCVVSMVRGHVLFNKPLAWAIFSGDQVHYCFQDFFMMIQNINLHFMPVCVWMYFLSSFLFSHDMHEEFTATINIEKSLYKIILFVL